jgi:DNA repair photolyase
MKRYTGHLEPWGDFVDVKANAPAVLERQVSRGRPGRVFLSTVTDPYQPAEETYRVTRGCLEILSASPFQVDILTKSPLVLRDIDVLTKMDGPEVGITITTDDDRVRRVFEPRVPSIGERIEALKSLHEAGFATYAFIGPVLPMNPEVLARMIRPYVSRVLIDGMNYVSKTRAIYKKMNIEEWLNPCFVEDVIARLRAVLGIDDITLC